MKRIPVLFTKLIRKRFHEQPKNISLSDYAFMIVHDNSVEYTILSSCLKACTHLNNEKDIIPFLCSQPIFLLEFVFFVTKKAMYFV